MSRPTMDIDFLGKIENNLELIVTVIKDVCAMEVESDGIVFHKDTVTAARITEDADYKGARVLLRGNLGSIRLFLQIDIGFGDVIVPGPRKVEYPVLLDFPPPKLDGYTMESTLAEKFQAMVKLNEIIVDTLLEAGVPAFAISPSSMLNTKGKRLHELDTGLVKDYIELGMVPVLYGDAVLDSEQSFAILSGDQLIAKLSNDLGADRVIFGSDVDGIFTNNPKLNPDAELIEKVSVGNIEANVGDTTHTDVTGGMLGKLSEAAEAVKGGAGVIMVNAFEAGRVKAALRGEKVIGTLLTL